MSTKICSKCKTEKSLAEFGKRKDAKDGFQGYCKTCRNKRDEGKQSSPEAKAYKAAHYQVNSESYKARAKHNREKDPVAHAAKKKSYRESNKEKVAEGKKRSALAKPEQYKAMKKRYYQENSDEVKKRTNGRYHGPQREEIIAKQKQYVEDNYEKVKESRKKGRIRKKSRAGKRLFAKLQAQGVAVIVYNADAIPENYNEGLIYLCSNSSNDFHKVGSTFGRGVDMRVSEHNRPSTYRDEGKKMVRPYYGAGDGCESDWQATHVYLLPGVSSADLQRIENKSIHVELASHGWHRPGHFGERELFFAPTLAIHEVITGLLSNLTEN